jgi:hypothetical protein
MRRWTQSVVFCNTTATTYSQFTEVLTNGLLSRNASIMLQYTSEIIGDSDSGAGQHKVPLGSFCLSSEGKVVEQNGSKPDSQCCQDPVSSQRFQRPCLTPAYVTGTQKMLVTTCYTVRYRDDVNLLIWLHLA